MTPEEFGKYLRELRKSAGYTLEELGNAIGLSKPYLSNIEHGRRGIPDPDILRKLADPLRVTGITYDELMIKAGYVEEAVSDSFYKSVVNHRISLKRIKSELLRKGKFSEKVSKELRNMLNENNLSHVDVDQFIGHCEITLDTVVKMAALAEDYKRKTGEIKNDHEIFYNQSEAYWRVLDGLDAIAISGMDGFVDDILDFLKKTSVTYNGHQLSDSDRKFILGMLDLWFKNRGEQNGQT
jgi:transcriptional regulator with XRE-family HTH domain